MTRRYAARKALRFCFFLSPPLPIIMGKEPVMSGCCGDSRPAPRYKTVKCPRCAGSRVRELGGGLSVVWYECSVCGYVWQAGW